MNGAILGIDPGTRKCGYAVVERIKAAPLELGVVPTEQLVPTVTQLGQRFGIRAIALGGGTHTRPVAELLAHGGFTIEVVDERETTLLARARYFDANPPRGWKRWVPRGLLVPPRPIDDFAALLIAERLLEREAQR